MPGPTVHFSLTMQWAIEEGLSDVDAEVVGRADTEVDRLWPGRRQWARHFNPMATYVVAPRYAREASRLEAQGAHDEALVALGRALHSLQDGVGHGRLGLAHLKYRVGVLKRHPDVWQTMQPTTRERIERATRAAVREFVRAAPSR